MRHLLIFPTLSLLALAGCHANVDVSDADGNSADGNVHVAMTDSGRGTNKVSVNVPGFSANVALPNMNLGSHVDLDGIKMAPNTKVGGLDVTAHDNDGAQDEGNVRLSFTDSDAPAAIIDHYARSAADAGYADIVRTGTSLTARKADKSFAVQVAPQGSGSKGTITLAGKG